MTPLDAVKLVGGPGSLGFLTLATVLGLLIIRLWPTRARVGRIWLLTLYLAYVILSVPIVALALTRPLNRPSASPCSPDGVDTVVVLDGDNRIGRVKEALRLWSAVQPASIVVSGNEWVVRALTTGGVPVARITHDESAANTREQIRFVGEYLETHRESGLAVVASRLQMPRVIALAAREGVRATFCGSAVDREPAHGGVWLFVPAYAALRVSRDGLYERAALAYYRWQHWIAPDEPRVVVRAR